MVEVELDSSIDNSLLVVFSICTTLVVAIHLLALMISTCILPNMDAVSNVHNVTAVLESPHEKLHWYIELAWIFSTGIGILLFLVVMAILAWVRFYPKEKEKTLSSFLAPVASTVIIIPCLIIFVVFGIRFYRQLISHKYERHAKGLEELENMAQELNTTVVARNSPMQHV